MKPTLGIGHILSAGHDAASCSSCQTGTRHPRRRGRYRSVGDTRFGYVGRPGSCLWCGYQVLDYGKRWLDGMFCTLKCAGAFGIFFANGGHRIEPESKEAQS